MLTRDELRDLLALYAGDDLEPELRLRVESALASDPALRGELARWNALEGLLQAALVPTVPVSAEKARVRVHCPVCKDALDAAPSVLCARCATPHHASCFAQVGKCALLGCESSRALGEGAVALRACAHCQRETAAEAPFCSWCGKPAAEPAPLRAPVAASAKQLEPEPAVTRGGASGAGVTPIVHAGGGRGGWSSLAAAALLLVCGLSLGAAMGLLQRGFLEVAATESVRVQVLEAEAELPHAIEELQRAQQAYREGDLDGDGRREFAPDLGTLLAGLGERAGAYPLLVSGAWRAWFELSWSAPTDPEGGQSGSLLLGFEGRAIPRFDPEVRTRRPTTERVAFDAQRSWVVGVVPGAPDSVAGVIERWRRELLAIPGVESAAPRSFEVVVRVADKVDPARILVLLPRALRAELIAHGIGLRVVAPDREVAFYGPELEEAR